MEIAAFKVKSGATEVQLMQTQLFCIPDSKAYKLSKVQQKKMSYERDMSFQRWNEIPPVNRYREETSPNYVSKHLNRYPSFHFSNLDPLSQSLKISCKDISLFLEK